MNPAAAPSPALHLHTAFILDTDGRIAATREPGSVAPPAFCLVRGPKTCAWAVRAGLPKDVAAQIDALASEEPPVADLREPPAHAARYLALLGGAASTGPAFAFPEKLPEPGDVAFVSDVRPLERHMRGWTADEIPGRSPIAAVLERGDAVSVCCCARLSAQAAEAGLETAEAFRGRGFAPRVTAAWARAVRESGRTPLYSTSWENHASRAVARKLELRAYASIWSVSA